MTENQKKFIALAEDEEKLAELFAQEDSAAAQKWLSGQGIELSIEEIEAFRAKLLAKLGNEEEMSDEQLEQVAGGGKALDWLTDFNLEVFDKRVNPWFENQFSRIGRDINNFFRRW